jgi:hypothetical protein
MELDRRHRAMKDFDLPGNHYNMLERERVHSTSGLVSGLRGNR